MYNLYIISDTVTNKSNEIIVIKIIWKSIRQQRIGLKTKLIGVETKQ